jgi:hypothetical protein
VLINCPTFLILGVTCYMNKTILITLTLIIQLPLIGQEIVRQESYYDFKVGIYETKSLDKNLLEFKPTIIEPQKEYKKEENTAFLKVEGRVIALFDKMNDSGKSKSIGVLTATSVIEVDTIFYKEVYKDTTKEWSLTFNVWYAITLNGKKYYTDYKIHDYVAFQKELITYNQKFLLVSQSTGYDGYYDIGYPNYFFVVVLDDKNQILFESDVLDFDYGDEFWDAELMSSVSTEMTEKGLEFNLYGIEDKFEGVWTGKKLIKYGR